MTVTHRVVDDRDNSIKLEGTFDECVNFHRQASKYSPNIYSYWIYTIEKHDRLTEERNRQLRGGAHGLCNE